MNAAQQGQLVDYIVGRQLVDESWIERMRCAKPGRRPCRCRCGSEAGAPVVAGFGFTFDNNRHLTAQQAGLSGADVNQLELAWALAFPRATTMRAQASVVGDTLYLPVGDEARLFAVDISGAKPCFKWIYAHDIPLRTGVGYGVLERRPRGAGVFGYRHLRAPGRRDDRQAAVEEAGGILGSFQHHRHAAGPWRPRVRAHLRVGDQSRRRGQAPVLQDARRIHCAGCSRRPHGVDIPHHARGQAHPRSRRWPADVGSVGRADLDFTGAGPQARPDLRGHRRGHVGARVGDHRLGAGHRHEDGQAALEIPGDEGRHLPHLVHASARRPQLSARGPPAGS